MDACKSDKSEDGENSMKIGCVKEIKNNEYRVGLTPDKYAPMLPRDTMYTWKPAQGWDPGSRTPNT